MENNSTIKHKVLGNLRKITIEEVFDTECEFYSIRKEDGVKYIEIDVYFHQGDTMDIVDCANAYMPLSEFVSSDIDRDPSVLLDTAKEYEYETTPEEVMHYIKLQPKCLPFEKITQKTPCGFYVNLEK